MSTTTTAVLREVELLRQNVEMAQKIVRLNVEGLTHEESVQHPQPAGNCINWVVGHLLHIYEGMLPLLGQKPVLGTDVLARYARGTPALQNPEEALPLEKLLAAWDKATERMSLGLADLTEEQLNAPVRVSQRNKPNETVRSLLGLVAFHQAYHAGQLGLLRRIAGKEGAIA